MATAAISFVYAPPVQSEGLEDVLARARKLNEAGEPSEATAVLARGVARERDPALLREWLLIDEKRITDLEARQMHKTMPAVPTTDKSRVLESVAKRAVNSTTSDTGTLIVTTLFPYYGLYTLGKEYDGLLKEVRAELIAQKAVILSEREVNARLHEISECGRSLLSCSNAVSDVLQSAAIEDVDSFLPLKTKSRSLIEKLRRVRADFVSYDHVAPRVIDAHVALIPDAFGVTGAYVSTDSLKRAAELLGESGRDLEFAHKEARRLWLDAMSQLKHCAGKEQFKDLETLATVVGNSKTTPDQWEPK